MNKEFFINKFIGKFPDVKMQQLETCHVESRAAVENIVVSFMNSFNSGLLYYDYSDKVIRIFTSDIMLEHLSKMKLGATVIDPNTGKEGIITSKCWNISHSCSPSITVDFGGRKESYYCEYFIGNKQETRL